MDALQAGRVAVVTGAASGIGLAAAQAFAGHGMRLVLADMDEPALHAAAAMLTEAGAEVLPVPTDVSRLADVQTLHARATAWGEVGVLMNNAGREGGGGIGAGPVRWHEIIDTNLWGVVHGVQTFLPSMLDAGIPAAIVNTGSKQGITAPPGDTAYNVSKAGIKVVTEALAHDLRSIEGCRITAHLLIPGFTFTGFTRVRTDTKPDAAWTAEQVVALMLERMARGDFYILCPDNDVTPEVDAARIRWAAEDIVQNRPPLSRWHPEWRDKFTASLKAD